MNIPHDLDAERAFLGALLNEWVSISTASALIAPEDLYRPAHGVLLNAVMALNVDGVRPEVALIRDQIERGGGTFDQQTYIDCITAASMAVTRNAEIIVRLATARRVLSAAVEITELATSGTLDPEALLGDAKSLLDGIDLPAETAQLPESVTTVDAFLTAVDETPAPWVVPGLMRRGWRCLLVAPEGIGKSVTARQIALCAAQGIHPFTHKPVPSARTLIIDLENPDDAIASTCRPINDQTRTAPDYDDGRAWIWREPAGMDLRSRRDARKLASVINAVRPDLICLGPMYKAYRVGRGESDEQAAADVQGVLDDLRTRYDLALLIEHHAPKSSGLGPRDLVPYGSSLWLRWPELGLTLAPATDDDRAPANSVMVGRFRRDRVAHSWPTRLDRDRTWPWSGYWRDGMTEDL